MGGGTITLHGLVYSPLVGSAVDFMIAIKSTQEKVKSRKKRRRLCSNRGLYMNMKACNKNARVLILDLNRAHTGGE
jgi:hypothetical protein